MKEHGGEREKILDSVKVTLYDVTLPSIERLEERTDVPPPLLTNFSRRSYSSSTFLKGGVSRDLESPFYL